MAFRQHGRRQYLSIQRAFKSAGASNSLERPTMPPESVSGARRDNLVIARELPDFVRTLFRSGVSGKNRGLFSKRQNRQQPTSACARQDAAVGAARRSRRPFSAPRL